jgi:alpha-1,3-rhamnosyltransferase
MTGDRAVHELKMQEKPSVDSLHGPLVTVAISCYNHEAYIAQSIQSVLDQNYPFIQLLVIDDGSSDGSVSVIEGIRKKHDFYFETQDNQGLTVTLNKALSMAKGKYFIPFGSDDIMMLDRISKQVSYMESHAEIGCCGGNILKINGAGKILRKPKINPDAISEFKHVMLNLGPGLPAPTLFFRTDLLREVDGFDTSIALEDLYIQLALTRQGHKLGVMNDVLAYYRVHDSNTYKNLNYMLKNVLDTYDRFKDSEYYQQARYQFLNSMLLKASKTDTAMAWQIFKMIPLSKLDRKAVRSLPRLLIKK